MKKSFLLLINLIFLVCGEYSLSAANPNWSYGYSAGTVGHELGRSIAFDSNGNYYLLGQVSADPNNFNTDIEFGNGVSFTIDDSGKHCFIVKFNSNDQAQWVKKYITHGNVGVVDIVIDDSDNIFITGLFNTQAIFETVTLTALGFTAYLAKFSSSGSFLWVIRTASPSNAAIVCKDLETDGTNLYMTGYFKNTQNFGGLSITSAGGDDIFIAKISNSGNVLFLKEEGGLDNDWGNYLAHDGANLHLTGWYKGISTIANTTLTSNGAADFFVAKYDLNGNPIWIQDAGSSTLSDYGKGVIVDKANGDVYVAGRFGGSLNIGGITLTSSNGFDLFLAKYNGSGIVQWAKQSTGSGTTLSGNLTFNGLGQIVVYASNSGEMTIESTTLNPGGAFKNFATFDTLGNLICLEQLPEPDPIQETSDKISSDGNGNIYKTGSFSGTISFGTQSLTSTALSDIYLVKQESSTVPLELISFAAYEQNDKKINLRWETQSEINIERFEIERRLDEVNWGKIGELKPMENESGNNIYNYLDVKPDIERNYYRLKIIDYDQSYEYSEIITIKVHIVSNSIEVYPIPFGSELYIGFRDLKPESIEFINISSGKTLLSRKFENQYDHSIHIDIPKDFPPGAYLLILSTKQGGEFKTIARRMIHY